MEMIVNAPAKINIILRVLGRRVNGYHDLFMLNEKLQIADEIRIEARGPSTLLGASWKPLDLARGKLEAPRPCSGQAGKPASDIKITCDDPSVPCDERNLCHKAASRLLKSCETVGDVGEINIHIKKRVPVAAGLGGGSSDAAAVLIGLNKMLELGLSIEELCNIGVNLGADVPFFLHDGAAICEGIGDKITTLDNLPNMSILLANPSFPVSTKWAYEEFDKLAGLQLTRANSHDRLPRHFKGLADLVQVVHNDLERVTSGKYPEIKMISDLILAGGASASWMSGSGPTVVGLFEGGKTCALVADSLRRENAKWRVIETSNWGVDKR